VLRQPPSTVVGTTLAWVARSPTTNLRALATRGSLGASSSLISDAVRWRPSASSSSDPVWQTSGLSTELGADDAPEGLLVLLPSRREEHGNELAGYEVGRPAERAHAHDPTFLIEQAVQVCE